MICPRKTLAVVLSLSLMASAAALQQAAPLQDDPRARIRTTVELVVVPVTVKDAQGRLVGDIRQDEFRIFEDGVEQKVALFSVEPFPLSAVILLDDGLKLKTAEQVQSTMRTISGGFGALDEVAIGRFDILFEQVSDFTADPDKVFDQLKRIELGRTFPGQAGRPMTAVPRVNTAQAPDLQGTKNRTTQVLGDTPNKNIDDAIYAAGQILRARPREHRKIIFLISDGQNSRYNTNPFADTVRLLLTADISVYAINVGEGALSPLNNVLAKYARATGGDVFSANTRGELERLYSLVTEEARNQYTLAYMPQDTDRRAEYHTIEVRVKRGGLVLLAREGYYAVPRP